MAVMLYFCPTPTHTTCQYSLVAKAYLETFRIRPSTESPRGVSFGLFWDSTPERFTPRPFPPEQPSRCLCAARFVGCYVRFACHPKSADSLDNRFFPKKHFTPRGPGVCMAKAPPPPQSLTLSWGVFYAAGTRNRFRPPGRSQRGCGMEGRWHKTSHS